MTYPVDLYGTDLVVIPAYEPTEKLLELAGQVAASGYGVIVVNDGSSLEKDWIFQRLEQMREVVVLRHPGNMGKGVALKTAFRYIKETADPSCYIATMDADGQHLPADLEKVVMTARCHPGSLALGVRDFSGDVPLRSRLGNKLTRLVFRLVSRTKVTDTQTGLRAFGYPLLEEMLQTEGTKYEYEMNVLLRCGKERIPLVEVPIQTVYLDAQNSSSHFHPFQDSMRVIATLLKFASASLASFALDYAAFLVLAALWEGLSFGIFLSNVAARVLSALFNYTLNKKLVFHHKDNGAKTLFGYLALAAGILLANNLVLSLFAYGLGLPLWAAKIATELSLFVVSLTVQAKVIFREKHSGGQARPLSERQVSIHDRAKIA